MTTFLLLLALQTPATPPPAATAPRFDLATQAVLRWDGHEGTADLFSHLTSGLGGSYPCVLERDGEACKRAAIRVASAAAIAESAKRLVNRWRPDLSDDQSFFSQHTAVACSGVGERRGRAVSIALCLSTAYLRIAGDKHWLSDVLVGMAVGWYVGYQERAAR